MTESTPEPLLTRSEVADIYRVPESTIRAWAREGVIPTGFFVGKHLRWDPEAIRVDIASRRAAASHQQEPTTSTAAVAG